MTHGERLLRVLAMLRGLDYLHAKNLAWAKFRYSMDGSSLGVIIQRDCLVSRYLGASQWCKGIDRKDGWQIIRR